MSARVTIKDNRVNYDAFRKRMKAMQGAYVKVGFPEGEPVGEAKNKGSGHSPYSDISEVVQIAVWNEFGVPNEKAAAAGAKKGFMEFWKIPPRPFFRNAIDGNRETLKAHVDKIGGLVIDGDKTVKEGLELIGIFMQDKVKGSITATLTPPNAESTIKAKGSSHPLLDTGQMRNSVTFTTHEG